MKIAVDIGHNCPPDIGASGIRQEDELTRVVGNLVIQKLRALGCSVTECLPKSASSVEQSLYLRVSEANMANADTFVSIHFNCGGGHGTEVYAASPKGREIAQSVLNDICGLGYSNRGVKDGSHLYVIKNTNAPAILIECSFVDSAQDMADYNADSFAKAIVKGLTGQKFDCSIVSPYGNIILRTQKFLNNLEITDANGNKLLEDGIMGQCTRSALNKLMKSI